MLYKRLLALICATLAMTTFTACGQEQNNGAIGLEEIEADSSNAADQTAKFRENCITEPLAGGKKNGSFTDYREAYTTVSNLYELEHNGDVTYNLVDVDNDDIPELVAGVSGYYVSLYTYHDGSVYTLMNDWGYGAMGNAGYEYAPKENNLRNYNTDHAGAVSYTTYMAIGKEDSGNYVLDTTAQIKTVNFDDVNENGVLDENEFGSLGMYGVNYLDGKEIAYDEIPSFDAEHYEYIEPEISLEDLINNLNK